MKLGIVARMDHGGGLASQTYNLTRMLKPSKVLLIDSTPFNDAKQSPEMYDGFNVDKVYGFPNIEQYRQWLDGLTHVLTAETFYSDRVINYCLRHNIKTYVQPNYEFMDSMVEPITPPTKYFMPSHWKLKEVKSWYPNTIYLPPPLFQNDFKQARKENFDRGSNRRFLHVVGKMASKDRNGTECLLESLAYTDADFELVIKSQHPIDYNISDPRVKVEIRNNPEQQDLYRDFDAMILPRRYGGLCLPMNEALIAGLPVIMNDISPSNEVLPTEWLVGAVSSDKLLTRMVLDVYDSDRKELAEKIDQLCDMDLIELNSMKALALSLGMNYAADNLKSKYMEAMG